MVDWENLGEERIFLTMTKSLIAIEEILGRSDNIKLPNFP